MSKLPDPFREGLARGWKATHGEQGLPSQIECDVVIVGTGAGAGGRNAIGTAVLGGTVASTVLGIFMVPVFFLLIRSWFKSHARQDDAAQTTPAHPESAA